MDSSNVVRDQLLFNESANVPDITAVTISYLLCIFGGSLSVLIMCGNLLVIISIVYFKQLHTPTNFLMLSLAVADLLVGILVVPFSIIIVVSSYFRLQYILCRIRSSFDMILCNSSIWNLCCISVDRYYAVCQPLRYRTKINGRVVGIMILVSWTIATLNTAIQTLQALSKAPNSKKCVLFQRKTQSTMVLGGLFAFGIPAVIMSTIYLKIFMVARKQARSILSMAKSGETVSKMEKKATKTLSIVMGIFLLSWTPFVVCITFHRLSNYPIPVHVIQSLKWLGWSNSMLNPFVYAFFYSWFRSAFKMIITGKIFKDDFSNSNLF
ncbi:trace amine-associated receptor 4-like [Solea solea]|uniref:trace amine-associated receptor 4-like n=1 Tax=Solea solea TaxID=90069 RepID=UPI00272CAE8F|nr:trace amine-associated receptor 4-like [Solea solea]